MAGGMSKMAKQELLQTIRDRYQASSRKEKSRILDEFIAVTSHVLRDQFFHEVIEIINGAAARHQLKGHAGLE